MSGDRPARPARTGSTAPPPVFLERQSYRRRRLSDAARLLPLLGALLFAVPLLWPQGDAGDRMPTSSAILYIFGIWASLILVNVVFGRLSRRSGTGEGAVDSGDGGPETGDG